MRLLADIGAQMLDLDVFGYCSSISLNIDYTVPVSALACADGPRKKVSFDNIFVPDHQYAQVKRAVLIHISRSKVTPYRHQIDEKWIGARQVHSHACMEGRLLAQEW